MTVETQFLGFCLIYTASAVLGGVVEVVSSIPAVDHKNILQHFPA